MLRFKPRIITTILTLSMICMAGVAFAQEERALPMKPDVSDGEINFSSSMFQENIRSETDLGVLAKQHTTLSDQAVAFGFAAKSTEAKFFIIGSLYARAVTYLRSGNFEDAAKQLAAIEQECINLQVPSALYNYLSRTRNMIERKQYSEEALGEFLALLQPFLDDYARSQGDDKLILFRAGTWLVDLGLTAAAKDIAMLRQSTKAQYLSQELRRLNAPKGVLQALDQITRITEQQEITDADATEVLQLVKQIQTLLG